MDRSHPDRQCRHHPRQSVGSWRDEDWDDVINVNLTGPSARPRCHQIDDAQTLRPYHAITSIVGVTGNQPGQYTASKAGYRLIKAGAEYAKRNVTANCIAPGFIKTPMTDALTTSSARPFCEGSCRTARTPRISRLPPSISAQRGRLRTGRPSTSTAEWP